MINQSILFGTERNGVIRLRCLGAYERWVTLHRIKGIHVCIWAIRFEIIIILNARGQTDCGAVVCSCTTIWVIVRVGRETCSAGTIAPGRESSRLVSFLELYGTVRAKVNATLGDTAICIIVDAHRHIEAVNKRNLVIIRYTGIRGQSKLSDSNWRLSLSGAEQSTGATSIKTRICARIGCEIAITTTPYLAHPVIRHSERNVGTGGRKPTRWMIRSLVRIG